jgi:hypothetical protein
MRKKVSGRGAVVEVPGVVSGAGIAGLRVPALLPPRVLTT